MAKRMKFSVVGLPHYTVWHLYEPSVDDIRHMEEMAQEQKNRENEEKERAERIKKIKDEFKESNNQWENDKNELQNIALKEEEKVNAERIVHIGAEEGPMVQGVKESTESNIQVSKDASTETGQPSKDVVDTAQPSKDGATLEEVRLLQDPPAVKDNP